MKFIFSPNALRGLKKLDTSIQERIWEKIDWLKLLENPSSFSKILVNKVPATYRFRVGDYRIIGEYHFEKNEFLISQIGHRKDIYRD
jgi:mRNA interferase RelE/StbE